MQANRETDLVIDGFAFAGECGVGVAIKRLNVAGELELEVLLERPEQGDDEDDNRHHQLQRRLADVNLQLN